MKNVTIGFSKPKNRFFPFISYLIRLYLKTTYSHVYLKFYSQSIDRNLVYEAVGNGIRFVGMSLWSKYAEEVKEFHLSISDEDYKKVMQYCVDNAGLKYGPMQNLGILISGIFYLKQNPFKSGKVCSEVIAEILINQGFKIDKPLDLVTPKDIYEVLYKHNNS